MIAPLSSAQENLILDAGFEQSPHSSWVNWKDWGPGTRDFDNREEVHSGTESYKLTVSVSTYMWASDIALQENITDFLVGDSFEAEAHLLIPESNPLTEDIETYLEVVFYDGQGINAENEVGKFQSQKYGYGQAQSQWVKLEISNVVPLGAQNCKLQLVVLHLPDEQGQTGNYSGVVYFDDVSLIKTISKKTTAVSSSDENFNLMAEKTVDNNIATRWASAHTNSEWIYLDLGSPRAFDTVKLSWETAYAASYEIQISNDAQNWSTIYTENSGNGGEDVIHPGEQTARYIKMKGLIRGTEWGYSLWEFEISKSAASSSESAGLEAYRAADGDMNTRWASAFSDNEWIYIDYMNSRAFDTIELNWESAYGRQYEIQVSDNGINWTTIYTETNSNGGVDIINVDKQSARFVRMNGISRATPYGYSLWEFKTMMRMTAVSSSDENLYLTADKAMDGNFNSRWSSAFTDNEWIYIDLSAPRSFDTVKLTWETAYGLAYEIQISDDAQNWNTVYTETSGDGGEDVIFLGTQTARYVKMQGIQGGTEWGYSLREFEVLGTTTVCGYEKRINCGGEVYTARNGDFYAADQQYSTQNGCGYVDGNWASTSDSIEDTEDDILYRSERYNVGEYKFDVPDGTYTVTLKFAETYFTGAGKRVFSVWIEGEQVLQNLDIYAAAGHDTALDKEFTVKISDGQLNITALAARDCAKFSAISVVGGRDVTPPNLTIISPNNGAVIYQD